MVAREDAFLFLQCQPERCTVLSILGPDTSTLLPFTRVVVFLLHNPWYFNTLDTSNRGNRETSPYFGATGVSSVAIFALSWRCNSSTPNLDKHKSCLVQGFSRRHILIFEAMRCRLRHAAHWTLREIVLELQASKPSNIEDHLQVYPCKQNTPKPCHWYKCPHAPTQCSLGRAALDKRRTLVVEELRRSYV